MPVPNLPVRPRHNSHNFIWDTGTLMWVAMTQPAGGIGVSVSIIDGADATLGTIANVAVQGDNAGTISAKLRGLNKSIEAGFAINALEVDYVGGTNPIYIGFAPPSTATAAASWQVRKLAFDVNNNVLSMLFASGTSTFDKVWDNRAGYGYS
jgi:hypothetical protein